MNALSKLVGSTDIYLLDQIMKNRIQAGMKILDAGCGSARNLGYFIAEGFDVYGIDASDSSIEQAKINCLQVDGAFDVKHLSVQRLGECSFDSSHFNFIICNAVLHFASDYDNFQIMIDDLWRMLAFDGILFIRLASTIGLKGYENVGGVRVTLPDGSDRFVVDMNIIEEEVVRLNAEMLEPVKTVNVNDKRCMTTLVLKKN